MMERESDSSERPPAIRLDGPNEINTSSLADCIQWFLERDRRVAVIRHPKVEELFQWKQERSQRLGEEVYLFNSAEDRLAIGIIQALSTHTEERELHEWISQLLNAIDDTSKTNEGISESYKLETGQGASALTEAAKIPTETGREIFLTSCWLEALCTAEVRVLGWVYQELYGRSFHPDNF